MLSTVLRRFTGAQVSNRSKLSPLEAARSALDAARLRVQEVAAQKLVALQQSDSAWSAWGRQRELADAEVARLTELVARLEAEAASAEAKARSDRFRERVEKQATENAAVAECIRSELPAAWKMFASVLERIARAEIATQQLISEMPNDFDFGDSWIGNPEAATRWRPPVSEQVLSRKLVELWVDKNGNPFVDQTRVPTVTANKRAFHEVRYVAFSPAATVPKLYSTLVVPRFDSTGEPLLFDGAKMRGPHDVLAALQKIRERVERKPAILVKFEPADQTGKAAVQSDLPPAISGEVLPN